MYTQQEVLDYVKEEDVKFVRLVYFDIKGKQKNISIMADQLERAFKCGISFDASSIDGFETPDHSDMFLHPDSKTLSLIPWRPNTGKVVRMFCDIRYPDGKPYEKDVRYILRRAIEDAEKQNVSFKIGSEMEFYLFKLDENGLPTKIPFDNAGYMDIAPEDKGENIRREICFTLEQMGITPEASHHEIGPGQNEVDFHYSEPLTSADNTQTFKWIVRTKAQAAGLYADFNPKPLKDKAGSGMHVNISCSSKTPEALAGILKHIEEITLFLNPTENSYNRLGECKAPKYITYGDANRSACIRIPASKEEMRIEVRSPDPGCNPYLAFTLLIYAALDGIKNNLSLPEPVNADLFSAGNELTSSLKKIPDTLEVASEAALSSGFVKSVLPSEIIDLFTRK